MLIGCLNISYILLCVYFPSWPSGIYLVLGLWLWINNCLLNKSTIFLNYIGLIASLTVLILKGVVFLHNYLGYLANDYILYSSLLESFGIYLEES